MHLDETDGADGDQILDVDPRILEAAGDVDHQPQVPLDESLPGLQIPLLEALEQGGLLLPGQGRRQGVAAPDVVASAGEQQPPFGQQGADSVM